MAVSVSAFPFFSKIDWRISVDKAPDSDAVDQPHRHPGKHDRRPAVAHQGERNSRDRDVADDHAYVHQDLNTRIPAIPPIR